MNDNLTVQKPEQLLEQEITLEGLFYTYQLKELKAYNDEVLILAPSKLSALQRKELYDWYDIMIDRDSNIKADLGFRKNSILKIPFDITWNSDNPKSVEAAELVKMVIKNIGKHDQDKLNFYQGLIYLLGCLEKGFSILEVNYKYDGKYILPYEFIRINQNDVMYNNSQELRWVSNINNHSSTGQPLTRNKFIIHKNGNKDIYGTSVLGSAIFWAYYYKMYLKLYLGEYSERFAKPNFIAQEPPNFNDDNRTKLVNMLANLYKKRVGSVANGVEIQLFEPSGSGKDILRSSLDYFDSQIDLTILGQANTSNTRGSGSKARDEVAKSITVDIVNADAINLEQTINDWIRFWLLLNIPDLEDFPQFKFKLEPELDLSVQVDKYNKFFNMGMPLSINQIRNEFKFETPIDEIDTLIKPVENNSFPTFSNNSLKKK